MPKQNPENDTELEKEVDNIGVVHLRKHTSETKVLPGYGTTNFGVSAYETKRKFEVKDMIITASLATSGLLAWKFKDKISAQIETLATYALLLRESRLS